MYFKVHKLHISASHWVTSLCVEFIPHGKLLWACEFLTQMTPETFYRDFLTSI